MSSPHLYISDGLANGHDEKLLQRAWQYQRNIAARGAYPLLTLTHLSRDSGTNYGYIRAVVERGVDEYASIVRHKRTGGTRRISSPNPVLMGLQRWILDNVLCGIDLSPAAFAYRRGLSIKTCATQHIGSRWLLKFDLHDFFGSVEESRVYPVFRDLGYPALLAFELARICTRVMPSQESKKRIETRGIRAYSHAQQGVLPQGAPTSGSIANAVALPLDEKLTELADLYGLVYTRYSDDLTFSTASHFDRGTAAEITQAVARTVTLADFKLHAAKTRIVPPGARHIVLGLLLGPGSVRLLPEFRRQLNNHVRCVEKFGPASHARARGFDSTLSMINYVDGCVAFASDIEPEWALLARERWNRALATHGHPFP